MSGRPSSVLGPLVSDRLFPLFCIFVGHVVCFACRCVCLSVGMPVCRTCCRIKMICLVSIPIQLRLMPMILLRRGGTRTIAGVIEFAEYEAEPAPKGRTSWALGAVVGPPQISTTCGAPSR